MPVRAVSAAEALADRGLAGDCAAHGAGGGKRQVTLLQAEDLAAVPAFLCRGALDPALLRHNLVVSGIKLFTARSLWCSGKSPAARATPACGMEEALGAGGYNALRGHGSLNAHMVQGGCTVCGDAPTCMPVPSKTRALFD